jgi:hypothetical protein
MLEVQSRPLPQDQQLQLQKWLLSQECLLVRQCLLAEVAILQGEFANVITRNPDALRAQAGLDAASEKAVSRASKYQTFLNVLSEITSSDWQFKNAEVQITDK